MKLRPSVVASLSFLLLALPVQAAETMHKIVFQVNNIDEKRSLRSVMKRRIIELTSPPSQETVAASQ